MTTQEIRILAENRMVRRKRFRRFLFMGLCFLLLMWFVILENEPEAMWVGFTITGIFCGIAGVLESKAAKYGDIERLKRSRRERKIQKEMIKIEEELERREKLDYRREERLRLKELAMRYPDSDFV